MKAARGIAMLLLPSYRGVACLRSTVGKVHVASHGKVLYQLQILVDDPNILLWGARVAEVRICKRRSRRYSRDG